MKDGATTLGTSDPAVWGWANPVQELTANHHCQVASGGQKFLWVEGALDGALDGNLIRSPDFGLFLDDQAFAHLRHVQVVHTGYHAAISLVGVKSSTGLDLHASDCGHNGFHLGITGSRLRHVQASSNGYEGIRMADATDNQLYDVRVANNPSCGLNLIGASRNQLVGVVVSNCGDAAEGWLVGLRLTVSSTDNTLVNVLSHNNLNQGVQVDQSSSRDTFLNLTSANNTGNGIGLGNVSKTVVAQALLAGNDLYAAITGDSTDMTFANLALLHSGNSRIYVLGTAARLVFHGHLLIGGNGGNPCEVSGTVVEPGLVDDTCSTSGADGSSVSEAILHTGRDLTGSLVGLLSSDDAANPSDVDGARAYDAITDWLQFEGPYRGWGLGGGAFPDPAGRGRCLTGANCRIWDWRPLQADTVVRNINGELVPGEPCPASAHGDQALTDGQIVPNTFLINASEIVLDGIGDEDGLCESGETCLFSPNLGAYQGEGPLVGPCTFQDGAVSSVTLRAYSKNGVGL